MLQFHLNQIKLQRLHLILLVPHLFKESHQVIHYGIIKLYKKKIKINNSYCKALPLLQ
jgi:hypothetical protein